MNNDDVLDFSLPSNENLPEYQMVSLNKFLLLSFLSFGLYDLWWTYKAWNFFKVKESLDINSVARTIFAIFFWTSLFEKIKHFANKHGDSASYQSGLLVFAIFILNLIGRAPDPFWLISFLSVFCFIGPVRALNYAVQNSNEYKVTNNSGLNGRQIALVVIGGILWSLIIIGFMVEDPGY